MEVAGHKFEWRSVTKSIASPSRKMSTCGADAEARGCGASQSRHGKCRSRGALPGRHFDHAVSYLGQREGALHDLADDRRVLRVVMVLGLGLG